MKFEIKKKVIKPLCIYSLAFSMLLPSVASLADLDINLGGYGVVYAADVKAPTVDPVFYDATTISGANLAKARVNKKQVIATVHVTLKGEDDTVKATLSVTPTRGTTWSVDLPGGKKVEKGDTVTVYQQLGEDKSPEVSANAQASKASTVTLTMPSGEIWIEQTSSNIVNEDEQAEAVQKLKDANTAIAGDIKSVKFSIDGTEHAYYEVTYDDGSTSGKVEAPDLKIKQVTETSRAPEIESITIVDNVIKGKMSGKGPFDGIKIQLIINVNKNKSNDFCTDKGCKIDKDSSDPIDVTLQKDGTFSYTLKAGESLNLDQIVGVSVKEPHKFKSCSTTTVKPVTPKKTEVKDPRKLTEKDKKAIDQAIRDANTVNGESKLPDGTGFTHGGVPALIEFDKDGNARIISPNNVEFKKENGKVVYEKNADDSYKVKNESEVIKIPAKDLVKNVKPEAPTVALSDDKKNITITPNLDVDTDANIIAVSYKDKDDKDQKITATKAENGTWSITEGEGSVDQNGVVTLPKNKVKGKTDVTATVTDKGGVADDDKTPLKSDETTLNIEETKADKVKALGGLDPVAIKKWVGDKVDWKDGVKAKDDAKKDEVAELLKGATFEDITEEKRGTTKEGDFEGKIKITFDDKSELVVEKQMLYVSNLVTSVKRKDKVPTDALDVEFKLGEGTKVDNTDGTSITGPNSYQKYKVKPGTDLKTYQLPIINSSVVDSIKVTSQEGYTEPVWRDSKNGTDFVATTKNYVFTATATKTYDITFDANSGGGTKEKVTQKVNTEYELPAANTFTAPDENHEFSGWQIGDDSTNLKQPGEKITITGDTTVKAIWKAIEYKVKFQTEAGASGTMEDKTVNKGSKYELPKPTFTPEKGKEFAGWKVGDGTELKQAGEKIDISGGVTLTATWKDIMVNVSYDANGGSGKMEGKELKKGSTLTLPANGFTAPANKEFAGWKIGETEYAPDAEITVNEDTRVIAQWKDIMVNVSYNSNGGSGNMEGKTLKAGSKYTLLDNTFKAPKDNQEFDTWEVNGQEVAPGTEITVNKDTEIKAIWKNKPVNEEYKVSFEAGEGATGSMDEKTVKKGDKYELPTPAFNAPDGKVFAGWKVGDEDGVKQAGDKIDISGNVTLTATWKTKPGTDEPGTKPDPNQPGTTPEPNPNEPGEDDFYIPEFKIHEEVVPTYPVYAVVPKTEKVEKAEEVPVSLETHKAYIAGYEDNTLRAEGNLTRAEAAAMVTRLAGLDLSDTSMPAFKDMQKNAWYFRYINAAVKAKMLDADNGMMRPNDKITRAEFAKMLAAIDKENSSVSKFDDIKGHRYEKEINKIYGNNRIEGYEDGSFRPDAYLTRAESAAFLNRMFNRIADKEAYAGLEDKLARFKDFDSSKWYYDEMVEATNSHELTRRGKASDKFGRVYEKWTRILPSDVK